jgi:hypothetical protein
VYVLVVQIGQFVKGFIGFFKPKSHGVAFIVKGMDKEQILAFQGA